MFAEFANTLLRKRSHAILTVLIASVLPFGAWLGAVTMSFVTLRKGIQQGFIILLWCLLPSVVMTYFYGFWVAWESIVLCYFLLWLLSALLRITANWAVVMNTAVAFGLLSVLGFYAWMGDGQQYWLEHLIPVYQRVADYSQMAVTHEQLIAIARDTAECITGLQVAMLLLGDLVYLALARGLQAKLFNPGGLRDELMNVHLPLSMTFMWVGVWCVAWMQSNMAYDFLPVILLPFLLTGLSLVHRFRVVWQAKWHWLIGFYALLFAFFPYIAAGLIGIAILDSCFDLRKRYGAKPLAPV